MTVYPKLPQIPTAIVWWAGVVLSAVLTFSLTSSHYRARIAKMEAAYSQEKTEMSQSALDELAERETKMIGAIDAAQTKTTKARADADALGAANRRLQQSLNNYKAKHAAITASSGTSEFDTDPIGMLANLFGRVSTSCERISRYADEVKIAGELCESAWPTQKPVIKGQS